MSSTSKFAFIILALAISYAFVYSPMVGEISVLSEKKKGHEDNLKVISQIEEKKKELVANFDAIPEADKKDIDTIVPTSKNFMRLVSQIDAVASNYGISISGISSSESSDTTSGSIDEAQNSKPYRSVLISFTFSSSYENFKEFMNDLEKSLRILDVKSIELTAEDKGLNSYSVSFETYWLN